MVEQIPIIEEEPIEPDSDRESALSESHTNNSLAAREEPNVTAPHPINPPALAYKTKANVESIDHKKTKRP